MKDILAVRKGKEVRVIRDGVVIVELKDPGVEQAAKDLRVDERVRLALREVL